MEKIAATVVVPKTFSYSRWIKLKQNCLISAPFQPFHWCTLTVGPLAIPVYIRPWRSTDTTSCDFHPILCAVSSFFFWKLSYSRTVRWRSGSCGCRSSFGSSGTGRASTSTGTALAFSAQLSRLSLLPSECTALKQKKYGLAFETPREILNVYQENSETYLSSLHSSHSWRVYEINT